MDLVYGWRTAAIERAFRVFSRLPNAAKGALISGYAATAALRLRRIKGPSRLTYFVTRRCTRRCPFCFYAAHLAEDAGGELDLTEIARWAKSLPARLQVLSFSGGEPFLKAELPDIAGIFWRENRTAKISINSNGDLPQEAETTCRHILQNTGVSLNLQVSVTAPEELAAGSAVGETLERFVLLAKTQPRVSQVSALTTVGKGNFPRLREIKALVAGRPEVFHKVQWVRGIPGQVFAPPQAVLSDFTPPDFSSQVLDLQEQNRIIEIFSAASAESLSLMTRKQTAMLEAARDVEQDKRALFPCLAGQVESVVFEDGRVSICENYAPFASLRDFNCDFARLWRSPAAQIVRSYAAHCACTHPCNLTAAMSFNKKALQKILV